MNELFEDGEEYVGMESRLEKALAEFRSAAFQLLASLDWMERDEHDMFAKNYPFGESFDETTAKIAEWVDGITPRSNDGI